MEDPDPEAEAKVNYAAEQPMEQNRNKISAKVNKTRLSVKEPF